MRIEREPTLYCPFLGICHMRFSGTSHDMGFQKGTQFAHVAKPARSQDMSGCELPLLYPPPGTVPRALSRIQL